MATATKQLEAIHQEISQRFSEGNRISVTPLDGNPPEKYEITYRIIGVYKDDSGEILEKDSHTININIPFGFPHFPPSCKPKSDLFHPDFDPAAICIGDFWTKDRSIIDLIFYIGEMIAGRTFSSVNAFNEEAAKWYKDNDSRLPFDETDFSEEIVGKAASDGPTLETGQVESAKSEPAAEVSSTAGAEETELEIDNAEGLDEAGPDRFKLLAEQNRFFELDSVLANLSAEKSFEERENLAGQAASALQQAREHYDQGSDFEHQGNPGRALDAFIQVESFVSDYPGIQEDIERTTQAKELLGDWNQAPETVEDQSKEPAEEEKAEEEQTSKTEKSDKGRTGRVKLFDDAASRTSRIIPSAIGIALVFVLLAAGGYYFLNSSRLSKAQAEFRECQIIFKQNRFNDTERQCEAAIDAAKQIPFFKAKSRDALIAEIKALLNSEPLQQGLAGNRLLDGQYLPKKVVRTILAFKHFMAEGDKYFDDGDWQKAASNYREALSLAEQKEGVEPQLVFDVSEKLRVAEFNILLKSGSQFIDRGKWVLATRDLEQALEHIDDLTIENKAETIDLIIAKLADIALVTAKQRGLSAFNDEQYDKALIYYQEALDTAGKAHQPDNLLVEELKELVIKAELYQTIKIGRDSFRGAQWDQAINNYEEAIQILESNRGVFKQSNTEENRKKLARIILQTAIIRDKQGAAQSLKEQRYLTAIEKLQSIIDTIAESYFSKESEFIAVSMETKKVINQTETEMLLADKIAYLENNFKELFTTHYTGSPADALTDPKVNFEKRLGDKLIFRLECVEIGRGRPLKLVMRYIHDLNTGTWNFYSGKK